jgi:predicted RNA binding protein YcfA (HicA-like mRNA interferase family)
MSGLPRTTGKEVVQALQRGGFNVSHVRGSHFYLRRSTDPGLVVVPVHGNRDLPLGTLQSILKQASLSADELRELLR